MSGNKARMHFNRLNGSSQAAAAEEMDADTFNMASTATKPGSTLHQIQPAWKDLCTLTTILINE